MGLKRGIPIFGEGEKGTPLQIRAWKLSFTDDSEEGELAMLAGNSTQGTFI